MINLYCFVEKGSAYYITRPDYNHQRKNLTNMFSNIRTEQMTDHYLITEQDVFLT